MKRRSNCQAFAANSNARSERMIIAMNYVYNYTLLFAWLLRSFDLFLIWTKKFKKKLIEIKFSFLILFFWNQAEYTGCFIRTLLFFVEFDYVLILKFFLIKKIQIAFNLQVKYFKVWKKYFKYALKALLIYCRVIKRTRLLLDKLAEYNQASELL